jgi:hypothetical protein
MVQVVSRVPSSPLTKPESTTRSPFNVVQSIISHSDRLEVAQLLDGFMPDGDQADITVASLASSYGF